MSAALLTVVFWSAIVAIVIAQVQILASTRRVIGASSPRSPRLEWSFAIIPALVLALVLVLAWQAAMRGPEVNVDAFPSAGEVRS